ncbi:MAG: twin-arginine translocase subunit TatC, partial [Candidatus Omnitrophota bacterium]
FLIFVLLSQLPLLLVAGVYSGIIKQEFLRNRRREIYALSFILSAMLTPPDVLSQILLALPLISLLELSILISRFCVYNNKK